jgi:hypothetical protein
VRSDLREYCTLFDSNYLVKALAMYRSLEACGTPFHLTVFTFDEHAESLLLRLGLSRLSVVPLRDLESHDTGLAAVKGDRSPVEYCWTATPALPLYLFDTRPELREITYLDADLLFYSDPEPLFVEMGDDASVLITPHRFAPEYAHHIVSGVYNVQFVTFRRTEDGLRVLRWWRDRCLEWCYDLLEDGKLGDQKYLDDWPERFAGVHVLEHPGGGLAPWNSLAHRVERDEGRVTVDGQPLVFFHFHRVRLRRRGSHAYRPPGYHVPPNVVRLVYRSYLAALRSAEAEIRAIEPGFDAGFEERPPLSQQVTEMRMRVGGATLRRFPALARVRYPSGQR